MLDIAIFTSIGNALFFNPISSTWNCFFPQSLTNIVCWKTCEVCPIWYVRNDITVQFLAWRTPFSISAGMYPSSFCLSWSVLSSPSILKNGFTNTEFLFDSLLFLFFLYFFFFFECLEYVTSSLLASMISYQKLAIYLV